jgi:hypothetical protein
VAVSFRPESLGAFVSGRASGQIDYRLVRHHKVAEFKRGRMSRLELCDAHPELLRAARNVGQPTNERCPICDESDLALVSFAFGPRLPAHGRCITSTTELARLSGGTSDVACYVVEVCPACSWNHLLRTFPLGGRRSV